MHFEFGNQKQVIVVGDSGETLVFNQPATGMAVNVNTADLFKPLNGFLETLTPFDRAELFEYYNAAYLALIGSTQAHDLDHRLEGLIKSIYNRIDMVKLHDYVRFSPNIVVPPEIKGSYSEVDQGFLREKTYVRDEYLELVTFAIAAHLCVPIWNNYMEQISHVVSSDGKEYAAYELLRSSKLRNMKAYNKLYNYVAIYMTGSVETSASTLSGVGRDRIPEWITAMFIVRKLVMLDLTNRDARNNIIHAVHLYVDTQFKRLPKKFMPNVRERRKPGADGGDENEQSFIETYRTKQHMSYGELDVNVVYLEEDLLAVCRDIDETFDSTILDAVLAVSAELESNPLHDQNHLLVQWVLDNSLDTLEANTISRNVAIRAMIATQALLHHWGLHTLALLATGARLNTTTSAALDGLVISKLKAEQIDRLAEIYPNVKMTNKQIGRKGTNNFGYETVIEFSKRFIAHKYAVRTPAFLTTDQVNVDRFGHLIPSSKISIELADLLIKLDDITPEPKVL